MNPIWFTDGHFRTSVTPASTKCVASSTTSSSLNKRRSKSWPTSAATSRPSTGKTTTPAWVLQSFFHPGRGCSKAVEHSPRNQEATCLNPAGCWAFFLLSFPTFTNWVSFVRILKLVHLFLCIVKEKNWMAICAAWGETGWISSDWDKNRTLILVLNGLHQWIGLWVIWYVGITS